MGKLGMKQSLKKHSMKSSIFTQFIPRLALVMALAVIPCISSLQAADFTITQAGSPQCVIVKGSNLSTSEVTAVSELKKFIKEMSGADLLEGTVSSVEPKIVIGMEKALEMYPSLDFSGLGDDGYLVKTHNGDLILAGSQKRGTLYAVYTLLDRFGYKWIAPDETANIVPNLPTLVRTDIDLRDVPQFKQRNLMIYGSPSIWCARNKINSNGWGDIAQSHGGSFQTAGSQAHNIFKLVEESAGATVTDNMLALWRRKETAAEAAVFDFSGGTGAGTRTHEQLCLTDPDTLTALVEGLSNIARENPGVPYLVMSGLDNWTYCQDDGCVAQMDLGKSKSAPLVYAANYVAKELAKEFPDLQLLIYAYQTTVEAPVNMTLEDNVTVSIAPIEGNYMRPFVDGHVPVNVTVTDHFAEWGQLTDQFFVWNYAVNFAHYNAIYPNLDVLVPNIKFYRDQGVRYYMEQATGNSQNSEFADLKRWVLAQAMWNPDLDGQTLITTFLNGYYGAAAPAIQDYIDAVHVASRTTIFDSRIYDRMNSPYFEAKYIIDAELALRQAELLVAGDPVLLKRVQWVHLQLWYLIAHRMPGGTFWQELEVGVGALDLVNIAAKVQQVVAGSGTMRISEWEPASGWEAWVDWFQDYAAQHAADQLPAPKDLSGVIVTPEDWVTTETPVARFTGLTADDYYIVQACQMDSRAGLWGLDAGASDGWMQDVSTDGWTIQHHPSNIEEVTPGKAYDVYVRIKPGVKTLQSGKICTFGELSGQINGTGGHPFLDASLYEEGEWYIVKLGTVTNPGKFYFASNRAVMYHVYLDCYFFVEREAYLNITPIPHFSPEGGTFTQGDLLTITGSKGTLYYTLDGSDPQMPDGSVNPTAIQIASGGTIALTESITVKARALYNSNWSGLTQSTFIIDGTPAAPDLSPNGGAVLTGSLLTISGNLGNLYYTLDGSDPQMPDGSVSPAAIQIANGGTIAIMQDVTVKARALNTTNDIWSNLSEASFVIDDTPPDPALSHHGGTVSIGTTVTISGSAGSLYYTLDDSDPKMPDGSVNTTAILIASGSTITLDTAQIVKIKVRALNVGLWSGLTAATFDVREGAVVPVPQFSPNGGNVPADTLVTVETGGSITVFYTLDGTDPALDPSPGGAPNPNATVFSTTWDDGILITESVVLKSRGRSAGDWSSLVELSFIVSDVISPPVFSPNGGTVAADSLLTITNSLGNIYYTTDGTDPRMGDNSINPAATLLANGGTLTITQDVTVTARSLDAGTWSDSTQASFVIQAAVWGEDDFEDGNYDTADASLANGLTWEMISGGSIQVTTATDFPTSQRLRLKGNNTLVLVKGSADAPTRSILPAPFTVEFFDLPRWYAEDEMGLIFLYQDAQNYYKLEVTQTEVAVHRVMGGVETTIGSSTTMKMGTDLNSAEFNLQVEESLTARTFIVTKSNRASYYAGTLTPSPGIETISWSDTDTTALTTLDSGRIGFYQFDEPSPYNSPHYDNIVITTQMLDLDDDGLDDNWEKTHFSSITVSDGSGNFDGDAHSDGAEFFAGTDPKDAASVFKLLTTAIDPASGNITLTWSSVAGKSYAVQFSIALEIDDWTAVIGLEDEAATPPTNSAVFSSGGNDNGFYRVKVK